MVSGEPQESGPFSLDAVEAINRAYESAVEQLGIKNVHSERRAELARYVMEFAKAGETDEKRLRDQAIEAVNRMDWIKTRAHQIWEAEGRPDGKHDEHWRRAAQDYADQKAAGREP